MTETAPSVIAPRDTTMYSIEFCEEFFDHCEFAEVPDQTSSRNEIVAAIKAGEVALKLQTKIEKIPLWSPLTNLYLRCI